MKYKAILFDLDGTLLDSLDDLTDATNATMRQFQRNERTKEEVRQFVGNGIVRLIREAAGEGFEYLNEAVAFQREYYDAHSVIKTKPYDGILEMLEVLKRNGVKMAIVSNKPQPTVTKLKELFFEDYIDVAIGETPNVKHKPEPDTLFEALDKLAVNKDDAVYVGDSEVDVLTTGNASMEGLFVDWGFRDREVLKQAGAKEICSNPEELLYALNNHKELHREIEDYLEGNIIEDTLSAIDRLPSSRKKFLSNYVEEVSVGAQLSQRSIDDVIDQLDESFSESVLRLIDDKGYSDVEVYKRAGIDRKLFSKLRSNVNYQPSRNTALSLCLALKLSLDETKDLLNKAGFALSKSNKADMIIKFFIEKEDYDLYKVNEALNHFGETCL